jgi:tryptophanyl-tRNA synthetase
MITPLGVLENNPTWKEQLQELAKTKLSKAVGGEESSVAVAEKADQALRTHGFLGYPVLQAADVMMYKATRVPVGQDQLPHLELSREIARKFNLHFGETFPEPQPLVTQTPKLPGLDGRKMSKSYGNTLELYETQESLAAKAKSMYTDPKKLRKDTPGNPDPGPENPPGCVVYALHKLYTPGWEKIGEDCRAGRLGCMDDKKHLTSVLETPYSEFRARRDKHTAADVEKILKQGADKAREVAKATMQDVRRAMRLR